MGYPRWAPQIHLAKPHHSEQLLSLSPEHSLPFLPRTLSLTLSPCGPLPPSSSRAGCPPGLPRKSTRLLLLAKMIGSEMSMGTNLFQWESVLGLLLELVNATQNVPSRWELRVSNEYCMHLISLHNPTWRKLVPSMKSVEKKAETWDGGEMEWKSKSKRTKDIIQVSGIS